MYGVTLPGLIVLITFVAIGVVVAVIFVKVVAAVLRGFAGMCGAPDTDHVGPSRSDPLPPPAAPVRTCSNSRCRFPNKPEARYCAMCGQRLS